MTNYQKALAVLVVSALGIWGCAQGPAGGATAEKIKNLEGKVNRLEDDFRAATVARDQFRKKLSEAEAAATALRQEVEALQPVIKERDDLRVQLKSRSVELETVTQQFDGFRKNLKDLLGKTEAALTKPATPNVTTVSKSKNSNL
jgi:chromosome segregation ATPase